MLLNDFSYLYKIIDRFLKGNTEIDYIHLGGGRLSGKTMNVLILFRLLLVSEYKCALLVFKKYNKDIYKIEKDFNVFKSKIPIEFATWSKNKHCYNTDRSMIQFIGITERDTRAQSLKLGESSLMEYGNVIVLIDEIYQITKDEHDALHEAIRGYKRILFIYTTNFWDGAHWYIKKIMKQQKYNERELLKGGELYVRYDLKSIYHYTNYKINYTLSKQAITKLEQLVYENPQRARVVCNGYIGYPQGTILEHVIKKIIYVDKPPTIMFNYIFIGIDFGFKNDATAMSILATNDFKSLIVLDEYYHSNKSYVKEAKIMFKEIIEQIIWTIRKHQYNKHISVCCDWADPLAIELLQEIKQKYYYMYKFDFIKTKKPLITFRISFLQGIIGSEKLIIVKKNSNNLIRELHNLRYKDNATKESINKVWVDTDNHLIDAFIYAISYDIINFTENLNPYLFV